MNIGGNGPFSPEIAEGIVVSMLIFLSAIGIFGF